MTTQMMMETEYAIIHADKEELIKNTDGEIVADTDRERIEETVEWMNEEWTPTYEVVRLEDYTGESTLYESVVDWVCSRLR